LKESTRVILAALAGNAAGDFEDARSLPPPIYHDAEILALETNRIFHREWICLGRTAEIPRSGDFLSRDLVGAPVVAIRQRDESIRAFSNVCLHRAARLLDGDGHVTRISCPYHSWTYELDGRLIGAPFMERTRGYDVGKHSLKELRCDGWEGFIYVTLDADAPAPAAGLASLSDMIGDYRMADYEPVFAAEDTWTTNWKCLVENFMDAYHIHRVHRESFGKYGTSEDQTHLFDGNEQYSYHYVQDEIGKKTVHAHADNTWTTKDNRSRTWLVNIFPSHTFQLQPDLLWYLSILPDGLGKVSIRWAVSIPREILDNASDRQGMIDETMQLIHQVNGEDRPIIENVYRATGSPDAAQGPLSYLERNVWQFGRYLARKLAC
jgi:phenylpropionate dioxygenase-like ring-hydroxylating dioxygenase large terminal subunit